MPTARSPSATPLAQGAPYDVTVETDPSGQTCTVANGSGVVGSAESPTSLSPVSQRAASRPVRKHRRQRRADLLGDLRSTTGRRTDPSRPTARATRGRGGAQLPLRPPSRGRAGHHLRRRAQYVAGSRCRGSVQPDHHRAHLRHRPLVRGQSDQRQRAVRDLHDRAAALGERELAPPAPSRVG